MPNQIERDVYVLSERIKNPIEYVRATNTIPIIFHFRDYTIPSGATAEVFVQKPSGLAVYNTAAISGNDVIVDVTTQMFVELGISEMQVQLTNQEDNLVTFSIPVKVRPNYTEGDATESQNESSLIHEIQGAIDEAETATTEANQAAQAANEAAEAVEGAVGGVINDDQVSEYTTYSSQKLGNFSQLLTTAKNTFVAAINELVLKIGDLKELATTEKTDIVSAINEIEGDKLDKENIANNLTTTQEGYALDARQGKALDDKVTQLNSALVVTGFHNIGATSLADAVFKAHSQLLSDGKSINAMVSYVSSDASSNIHIIGSRLYANRGRYIACNRTNDDVYIFRITTESAMVYYKIQTQANGYTYP